LIITLTIIFNKGKISVDAVRGRAMADESKKYCPKEIIDEAL